MQAALDFIAKAADLITIAVQLGADVMSFVSKIKMASSTPGWEPSQADWDDLAAMEKPLRDQLNAPQPGDPA